MIEWAFVLTPLLVLPIVLLFRFVGCGIDAVGEGPVTQQVKGPPDYAKYILGENPVGDPVLWPQPQFQPKKANVIAYWRLVEPGLDTGVAADQVGFQNGEFRKSTSVETKPGDFGPGQALIDSAPNDKCRFFNGGFVFVEYRSDLYTDEFTIEAWVNGAFASGSIYTLFHAGGRYLRPFDNAGAYHGFAVFVEGGRWQVGLSGATANVFDEGPLAPSGRHHVAVSMRDSPFPGKGKRFSFFINGKPAGQEDRLGYSRPDGAPLLIGVGRGTANPTDMTQLDDSVRSHVQEVVLHRKALSQPEIENHVFINKKS